MTPNTTQEQRAAMHTEAIKALIVGFGDDLKGRLANANVRADLAARQADAILNIEWESKVTAYAVALDLWKRHLDSYTDKLSDILMLAVLAEEEAARNKQ